jgi:WD40 repeat protein
VPPINRWELPSCKRLPNDEKAGTSKTSVNAVAFSPDGEYALLGGGDMCEIDPRSDLELYYTPVTYWSLEYGRILQKFKGHFKGPASSWGKGLSEPATISCLAVLPNGSRGLSGGDDGMVRVWGLS